MMTPTLLRDLFRGFVDLIYPAACLHCGAALGENVRDLCPDCRAALLDDPHATCPRCASTLGPNLPAADHCTKCRNQSFAFDRAVRLGPYEGLRREVILKLKHSANEGLAEVVGEAWAAERIAVIRNHGIDAVVPVPLHWRRRWTRGYNQAESLAAAWAKALDVPIQRRWLKRIRPTPLQTTLSATARRDNVYGAFRAARTAKLRGAVVLLVDDVMTTGATANEAAKALKKGGAARVIVAALGHG
jgi:ComF family protein